MITQEKLVGFLCLSQRTRRQLRLNISAPAARERRNMAVLESRARRAGGSRDASVALQRNLSGPSLQRKRKSDEALNDFLSFAYQLGVQKHISGLLRHTSLRNAVI